MSDIHTKFHYLPESDTTGIERIQDCTPIVERATKLRTHGMTGSKDMRHAASFPLVIIEQYMNNTGIGFDEFLREPKHAKAMLNDPALAAFRIWEGRA
jgi:hypothetical protein